MGIAKLGWEGRCGRRKGLLVIVPTSLRYLSLMGTWIWAGRELGVINGSSFPYRGHVSCSSAVFVFLFCPAISLLKTLPPSLRQQENEQMLAIFPPLPLSSGSLKTPCPQRPKRAIFITAPHFCWFTIFQPLPPSPQILTQMPLASLMDACLFLSHQSSSVEPL